MIVVQGDSIPFLLAAQSSWEMGEILDCVGDVVRSIVLRHFEEAFHSRAHELRERDGSARPRPLP